MTEQLKHTYDIPELPPSVDLETKSIFRLMTTAHSLLGEVKGKAISIPNQQILINSLTMQEAKASSEIENVITTQDEVFQASSETANIALGPAKEVALYRDALMHGHNAIQIKNGSLTNRTIIEMFQILKGNNGEFRKTPGTALKNENTGETVYVPPQNHNLIEKLMQDLDIFINDDSICDLDPLVKMALIHHQFESIHPFPDGNGRVGRIINVLYLTRTGLLEIPILYLSRYVNQNKGEYYRLLQSVRDEGNWTEWVEFMLRGVIETSADTLKLIEGIRSLMANYKHRMRLDAKNIYSQDILNNLFKHPYTRIEFVEAELRVSRQTASKYLDKLAELNFLEKVKLGRGNYYINRPLADLLYNLSG